MLLSNDQDVQRIVVGDIEFRLSQFADDTVLFLNGTERSMYGAFNVLDYLKVNVDKTNAVWIGSMKGTDDKL